MSQARYAGRPVNIVKPKLQVPHFDRCENDWTLKLEPIARIERRDVCLRMFEADLRRPILPPSGFVTLLKRS